MKWRSVGIICAAIAIVYGTLWLSAKLAAGLGLSKAYLLNDAADTGFAVLVSGAFAVFALKMIFKNTMGADFGDEFDKGWGDRAVGMSAVEKTRWMIVAVLVLFIGGILAGSGKAGTVMAGPLEVSQESVDHMLEYEVGGRAYFERHLRHPTVPAPRSTSSGCTLGFGCDAGHTSKAELRRMWTGVLTPEELRLVLSVQGLKGMKAYYATKEIRHRVTVTWAEAELVFRRSMLQTFGRLAARAYDLDPGQLTATQNGLVVSMTLNRGAALREGRAPDAWDRYMEKRWIKHNIGTGKLGRVPGNFEHMTRLWKNVRGLRRRYYAAASIWRADLNA